MNWFCVQNGAREHYAIPRVLHRSDRLAGLFTEMWAGPVVRCVARPIQSGSLQAMAGRWHPELEEKAKSGKRKAEIVAWNISTGLRQLALKTKAESGNSYARFIHDGRWFSEKVRDYLARQDTEVRGKVIFSYDTTALELFRWARERGAICILGQMDPGRVEMELVQEEERRWPGWARNPIQVPEEYYRRREEEWQLAHRIVVNSKWSADALARQGVPQEKLMVIPLAYEAVSSAERKAQSEPTKGREQKSELQPLKVLWLGQVNLRKGIQYLIEAAKLLQGEPVQFGVVGPVGISDVAVKSAPSNVTFHGRAVRDEASAWYARSDVFVLPTISDGFAITQIEAMAHGLPVIVTPNCGAVVTDGAEGFIVPARDGEALNQTIRRYVREPELLRLQRVAAQKKAKQFSLARLEENILKLEDELAEILKSEGRRQGR